MQEVQVSASPLHVKQVELQGLHSLSFVVFKDSKKNPVLQPWHYVELVQLVQAEGQQILPFYVNPEPQEATQLDPESINPGLQLKQVEADVTHVKHWLESHG
jgi:hypothetical protein